MRKAKKVVVWTLTMAMLLTPGLFLPQNTEAKTVCPTLKAGDYFVKKHTKFVHYLDSKLGVRYYGTRKDAKNYGINFVVLNKTCFNKLYSKQDIQFYVAAHDMTTNMAVNGAFVVMYKYKIVKTNNPLYSSTGNAYKIVDYVIKQTDETPTTTYCGLTGKFSAKFDIMLGEMVDFYGFKTYTDAQKDISNRLNKKTIYGHPFKNFGKPANALMQTAFRNPKAYAVFSGLPSVATGISVPL